MPGLRGWENAALDAIRRLGLGGFVAVATMAAIASSLLLATLAMVPLGGFEEARYWQTAYAMSAGIPALVAPPVTFLLARLIIRLDEMTDHMRVLAVTDPLTGVGNRRGFFDTALAGSAGRATPRRIAIFDIDEFKSLNDAHGHPTGDVALRLLADWLTDLVDGAGHVARFGGDEFVVVGAPESLDGLPRTIEFSVEDASFSVSIGRAEWLPGGDLARALADADDDLYKTKVR